MPVRSIPLVNEEIYHIFNRGTASLPIFKRKNDYQRFTETFLHYQNDNLLLKFSYLSSLPWSEREKVKKSLREKKDFIVEIFAYCLMPNHFHFLLRQQKNKGIQTFISNFTNSYSHFFSIRYKRRGSLFESRFKAVRVETEEQLLHLSRYIHLNPYSSYLVKEVKDLLSYHYSSFLEYLGKNEEQFCQKEIIMNCFSGPGNYQDFVFDQAEYQRELEKIKHLALE